MIGQLAFLFVFGLHIDDVAWVVAFDFELLGAAMLGVVVWFAYFMGK